MAYIPEQNTIALEIAKSGSRTLFKAVCEITGTQHPPGRGHHNIAVAIQRSGADNPNVIAVIRDPAERLVSAINFHFSRKDHTLDSALNLMRRNGGGYTPVFERQRTYLRADGTPHTLKLFPLERIDAALAEIGYKGKLWENKRPYAWEAKEIMAHPLWDQIFAYYAPDVELREQIEWPKQRRASGQGKQSRSRSPRKQSPEPSQQKQSTQPGAECAQAQKSADQTSSSQSTKANGETDDRASDASN